MRRWLGAGALTAILLWDPGAARAAAAPSFAGKYKLRAETKVHAPGYDQTFRLRFVVTVSSGASDDLTFEVRRGPNACTLHGKLEGRRVSFERGQKCPQSIDGEGFHADLDGVLKSGSATFAADGKLSLTTDWEVKGDVYVGPLKIPASGTVHTEGQGPKKK
jgi:hypothetical protein